jgi:hypothetical protein
MIDDWEKDEDGNIKMTPVVGYETLIAAQMAICVKLDYLVQGDAIDKPSGRFQTALTPVQARALAHALLHAAGKVDLAGSAGTPS